MAKGYGAEALAQLEYGEGQTLYGDGALVLLKALLEAGVAYLGGYPGSPVAHLLDAIADAYPHHLAPRGIYFDQSTNEAAAAALLATSLTEPVRGAVCWKHNGNTVAGDALNHLGLVGVTGGALAIVGEDYGLESSAVPLRTAALARALLLPCLDPPGDLQAVAGLVEPAFALSEAAGLPVFFLLRSRVAHLRDGIACRPNRQVAVNALAPAAAWRKDRTKFPLRPHNLAEQREQVTERLPRAQAYIREHGLNQRLPGRLHHLGLITHGTTLNLARRALELLGLPPEGELPVLQLNAVYPLVPEEVTDFLADRAAVLVVEEGRPALLEEEVRALAARSGLAVRLQGADLLREPGELTPAGLLAPLAGWLAAVAPELGDRSAPVAAVAEAVRRGRAQFATPLPVRPPTFCSGCPERPVFAALRLLEEETGEVPYYAGDVGCYGMCVSPPFSLGDTNVGMGLGLASAGGVARLSQEKVVSFMGDGTFWHSGLNTGVANAVYNQQPATLILFENYWTAMTGDHENPSSGRNMKGQEVGPAGLERALRGVGVRWVRQVRSYSVARMRDLLRRAVHGKADGVKAIVAQGECALVAGRREAAERARRLAAGERVRRAQYGVDAAVCTTCHACMRYNGCPSLTLGTADALRERPPATIDATCTGCGLCGELVEAASLCPSFYRVDLVHNPHWWERLGNWLGRRLARDRVQARPEQGGVGAGVL